MLLKIYHNNRCGKSRDALNYLESTENRDIEIIEYLKNGLSKEELISIVDKLKRPVIDIVRTNEKEFSDYKKKKLTDNELIELIVRIPKLLQRPIVIAGDKAVIGRPVENVQELVKA